MQKHEYTSPINARSFRVENISEYLIYFYFGSKVFKCNCIYPQAMPRPDSNFYNWLNFSFI
ncbi:MAG: hypothetical protein JWQ40_2123 [Segetibacter sp.]|nr:hypothetical protein [Segetibacter sp.]